MSRILRVSDSNYKVQVVSGGNITLDTGSSAGEVIITGDLIVQGNTTTINTANMTIEDKIVTLNKGETGHGVAPEVAGKGTGSSGIEIDRGSYPKAQLIFDETINWYKPATDTTVATTVQGTWQFKGGTATTGTITTGIQVASISTDGSTNLVFDLQNSPKVLEIANSGNPNTSIEAQATLYASRLLDADPLTPDPDTLNWIPNKKYISMYINSGVITPGMADVDKIYRSSAGVIKTRVQAYDDYVRVFYDNGGTETPLCTFASTGLTFRNNINIDRNTINNISTSNLVITAAADVEVDAILNLDNQDGVSPVVSPTATKLYASSTAGPGKTGIYFINKRTGEPGQAIDETVSDELIAKNRALLFSMIF